MALFPGEACLIPPHVQRLTCREKCGAEETDEELGWMALLFDLRSVYVQRSGGGGEYRYYQRLYQRISRLYWMTLEEDSFYRSVLERIPENFLHPSADSIHQTRALLTLAFLELSKRVAASLPNRDEKTDSIPLKMGRIAVSSSFETENIRKWQIESYISQNYQRDASLQELAQQLHLSVKQTERILRQQMGCIFREALLCQRMAVAWELILSGKQSLEEIGRQVGLTSFGICYWLRNVTTVSIDNLHFKVPAYVNSTVMLIGQITYVGAPLWRCG